MWEIVVTQVVPEAEIAFAIAQHCPSADRKAIRALIERFRISSADLEACADRVLTKPYGRNIIVMLGATYGISLVRMSPGQSTSRHFHRARSEVFVVRRGALSFYEGEAVTVLSSGGIAGSVPGEPHRLANEGADELEFIELFVPGDLNDKVRVNDRYGRALGPVSHQE